MFGLAPIYWVLINSIISFLFLYVISKILGKKQIAQLEFIDYAVGISLGSIATEMATDSEIPFYYYLIAMAIFFFLAIFVAILGRKSCFLKRLLKGKPSMLIYEGRINYPQLNKCKIDINDLLSMLREKGYFDVTTVAYAVFEPSGKLSVLPTGNQSPVVLDDLFEKKRKQAKITNILVADGEISKSGLNHIGKNKAWLFERLKIQDKKGLKNILLAVYIDENTPIKIYYKHKQK